MTLVGVGESSCGVAGHGKVLAGCAGCRRWRALRWWTLRGVAWALCSVGVGRQCGALQGIGRCCGVLAGDVGSGMALAVVAQCCVMLASVVGRGRALAGVAGYWWAVKASKGIVGSGVALAGVGLHFEALAGIAGCCVV